MWRERPSKDSPGYSRLLQPRGRSKTRCINYISDLFVRSSCGASRAITYCWKPRGTSNPPRQAVSANIRKRKARMKMNESLNEQSWICIFESLVEFQIEFEPFEFFYCGLIKFGWAKPNHVLGESQNVSCHANAVIIVYSNHTHVR